MNCILRILTRILADADFNRPGLVTENAVIEWIDIIDSKMTQIMLEHCGKRLFLCL